ncbi:hypothetical protein BQ8482_320012 [Mesorhizobium delmotii]|uniref:Uncharacterized protein n=1 Tax=Mesorhizobium delmotii TaxID=1631247 RepID=A0A2P9ANX1_9HYPH|nr:hypothetical protein BQ8482_320012 [Mesorhizobium delmotii]
MATSAFSLPPTILGGHAGLDADRHDLDHRHSACRIASVSNHVDFGTLHQLISCSGAIDLRATFRRSASGVKMVTSGPHHADINEPRAQVIQNTGLVMASRTGFDADQAYMGTSSAAAFDGWAAPFASTACI